MQQEEPAQEADAGGPYSIASVPQKLSVSASQAQTGWQVVDEDALASILDYR